MTHHRFALISTLALALACGPAGDDNDDGGTQTQRDAGTTSITTVIVKRVIDGDTIILSATSTLRGPDGQTLNDDRVRLLGIDAPEIAHDPDPADCWGDESAEFLKSRIQGRVITLEYDPTKCSTRTPDGCRGDFGRLLAYVKLNGATVNEEILSMGHARTLGGGRFRHRDSDRYSALEDQAQNANRGMWSCP